MAPITTPFEAWGAEVNQPLSVDVGDVTSRSDVHDRVAAGLSQVAESAPDPTAMQTAYGTISAALTSALETSLPLRDNAIRFTRESSETIADLLRRAAEAYARGDEAAADRLRAAADIVAGPAATNSVDAALAGAEPIGIAGGYPSDGAGTAAVATPAAGGSDMAGQLAGQVGQQVGQVVQGMAQAVQGLVQGLMQLPQQLAQVAGGTAGSPAIDTDDARNDDESARATEDPGDDDSKNSDSKDFDSKDFDSKDSEDADSPDREPAPRAETDGARPGEPADRGPEPAPAPERPRPAQTRPQ